jgi:hypothetical protein
MASHLRRATLAAFIAAASALAITGTAAAATSAPTAPALAQSAHTRPLGTASAPISTKAPAVPAATLHCNRDLCAELLSSNSITFTIEEYTTANFKGHFELQTPEHSVYNSTPDITYYAGSGHTFSVPAVDGSYCANQWEYLGPNDYMNIGGICWTINT